MNRILILLILVSNLGITITAQESSRNECPIRELNDRTEKRINYYLQRQSGIINLLVPYNYRFLKDSLFKETLNIDTINSEICKAIHQSVDSILIVLDNGLSWNLKK